MDAKFDFKDKTVMVTGAGRGIGRRLVEELCLFNANVIAVSKSQSNLDSLKEKCPKIRTVSVDLAKWKETEEKLKPYCSNVDFLVNNAAISDDSKLGGINEQMIDSLFAVNYKATLNLVQMVAEGMKLRRFGAIVNVSSVSGLSAMDGHCVYGGTKSAMDMLTRIAAKEFGKYNIRVNSVNPTVVWTDMGERFWSEDSKKDEMLAKIPMNRFVEVGEVVYPILFLLSKGAGMINGVILPIDGGFVAS